MIIVNARFLTQNITGVQRFAIEISKQLSRLSDHLVFVTPKNILDNDLAAELNAIVIGNNSGTVWEQLDLRNYLAQNGNPLLINFCNTGVLYYNNQIVTIHDMSYKVNPRWFSKQFYLWYNFLIPNLAKHSQKVFTVSNSAKNDITRFLGITSDKISVIYNSSYFNTNDNFETIYREKYLLSVSSLDPRKNLANLIKAYKELNNEVKLVIVGLKSSNFALKKLPVNQNIIIKGYVSDYELSSLMKHAEAFVYLSFYEGFGLPPLEAMSLGCPVVVSAIPSHIEVCGDAALYANPYDTDDIKTKLLNVLEDEQLRMDLTIKGAENIKRFDWHNSAVKVLQHINEFIT